MTIMRIVIVIFLLLEVSNVLTLYFAPGSKLANGVGIFNAWEKSKADPEVHEMVKYLVNWVAGSKLIFILLLVVVAWTADEEVLVFSCFAMAIAITSFYWRLFPAVRKMDAEGVISPKNYSIVLGVMIGVFILAFFAATIPALFNL